MNMRALLLGLLFLTAISSSAQSNNDSKCSDLGKRFKAVGLDIDHFRDQSISLYEKNLNKLHVPSDDVIRSAFRQQGVLMAFRSESVQACGPLNPQRKAWPAVEKDQEGVIFELLATWAKNRDQRLAQQKPEGAKYVTEKMYEEINKIDDTKMWQTEEVFTYPAFKGMLKSEAVDARKKYFQESVVAVLTDAYKIPTVHKHILQLLDSQTQEPLSAGKAGLAEDAIRKSISQFQMDDNDSEIWKSVKLDRFSNFTIASDGTSEMNEINTREDLLHKLVQDKIARMELFGLLLMSQVQVTAKRIDESHFALKSTIKFGDFYKLYPLKPIKDFVE